MTSKRRHFAVITHWSARYPPVAVFNSRYYWRPIVCCGWCSIMEQSATRYCCVLHDVMVPSRTQNISI